MLGASVPLISRKSYLSSIKKSLKTRAIVSPGSERMDHVQSRLLSYSAGYPGLVIEPAVPLNVPPHAPSADEKADIGWKNCQFAYLLIFCIYPFKDKILITTFILISKSNVCMFHKSKFYDRKKTSRFILGHHLTNRKTTQKAYFSMYELYCDKSHHI